VHGLVNFSFTIMHASNLFHVHSSWFFSLNGIGSSNVLRGHILEVPETMGMLVMEHDYLIDLEVSFQPCLDSMS
jgi:hypothetical protein